MEYETMQSLYEIPTVTVAVDQFSEACKYLREFTVTKYSLNVASSLLYIATPIASKLPISDKLEKVDKYVNTKIVALKNTFPSINKPTSQLCNDGLVYCSLLYQDSKQKSYRISAKAMDNASDYSTNMIHNSAILTRAIVLVDGIKVFVEGKMIIFRNSLHQVLLEIENHPIYNVKHNTVQSLYDLIVDMLNLMRTNFLKRFDIKFLSDTSARTTLKFIQHKVSGVLSYKGSKEQCIEDDGDEITNEIDSVSSSDEHITFAIDTMASEEDITALATGDSSLQNKEVQNDEIYILSEQLKKCEEKLINETSPKRKENFLKDEETLTKLKEEISNTQVENISKDIQTERIVVTNKEDNLDIAETPNKNETTLKKDEVTKNKDEVILDKDEITTDKDEIKLDKDELVLQTVTSLISKMKTQNNESLNLNSKLKESLNKTKDTKKNENKLSLDMSSGNIAEGLLLNEKEKDESKSDIKKNNLKPKQLKNKYSQLPNNSPQLPNNSSQIKNSPTVVTKESKEETNTKEKLSRRSKKWK